MHPFFEIFGKTIPSYGFMAGTGLILGLLFIILILVKDREKQDDCIYIYGIAVVGIFVGAKLLYLLLVLPGFIRDFPLIFSDTDTFVFKYISGGWVFYGGFIGAFLFALWAARLFKVRLRDYLPWLIPAMVIFAAVGRIGCFLAGCCYGIHMDTPISLVFPEGSLAPSGIPLLPTQLIEFILDLVILLVLLIYNHSQFKKGRLPKTLRLYLLLYAVMRFLLEFIRGDEVRGFFGPLSTSQWISILILLVLLISRAVDSRITKD